MRKFDYQYGNMLGAHGTPQQGYQQQGYQQPYGQPYPQQGYPQQQAPRGPNFDPNQVITALNTNTRNIETINNRVNNFERELADIKMKLQMVSNSQGQVTQNKDFRSNTQSSYNDDLLNYNDRRFGGNEKEAPTFKPEVVQEVEEEQVKDEAGENIMRIEVPKTNPFVMNKDMKWEHLLFDPTESYKKVDTILCESLTGLDIDYILDGFSTKNFATKAIIFNEYAKVDREFINRELMVPPEALHLTMKRLMSETKDMDVFFYLNGLDQLLTRKLNEYLELNIAKVSVPSYVNDYEELCFIIRERSGIEIYNRFTVGFSKIVNQTIRTAYEIYFDAVEGDDKKIPLVDYVTVVRIDKLSKFLGLNLVDFKYDEFTRIITADDETSDLFNTIIGKCEEAGNEDGIYYFITKDDAVFKLVMTEDKKLYMKRFLTNFN